MKNGGCGTRGEILIREVSKSYGSTRVLGPVDLHIRCGLTFVLIGPSGCGKSTLLRSILGMVEPDQGQVFFEGQPVHSETILSIRRKTGYVIQEGGLFPHRTARGNLTLMADFLGWSSGQIDARLAKLTELTRYPQDGLDRYPIELSGGQRQRVSLMRALMLDPSVLLLDEPLGALDPLIRSELQKDLRRIFRALKKTVVMVTHDMGEAAYFADVIVLLREGRIVQQGSLTDLVEQPEDPFVTRFINAQQTPLHSIRPGAFA